MEKSTFQFVDPVLTELVFEINEKYTGTGEAEIKDIPLRMEATRAFANDKKSALVTLRVEVAEHSNQYPCYIVAKMQSIFKWDSSVPQDVILKLLDQNAPALLLGYIRPYIAQITGAGPTGRLNIPFMDFSKSEKHEEKD